MQTQQEIYLTNRNHSICRVQHVTRWVFTLNFTKIFLPLAIIAFLTLLHPHTEIQVSTIIRIAIEKFFATNTFQSNIRISFNFVRHIIISLLTAALFSARSDCWDRLLHLRLRPCHPLPGPEQHHGEDV